ncbi:MAG: hypothetical protein E7J25_11470 [Paeniclostridium sordellii]|nr:hypothetical protein [Paeniclostridium sordellii]
MVQIEVPAVKQEIPIVNDEVSIGDSIDIQKDIINNYDGTNIVRQYEQDDLDYISDEMLNF